MEVEQLLVAAKARAVELKAGNKPGGPTSVVLTGGPGVGKTTLIDHVATMLQCKVVPEAAIQAINGLNTLVGKQGQKAWRSTNTSAFGDLVGRVAMAQEEAAVGCEGSLVLFDRTVLDNLGYSLERGYPLPAYLDVEVAAAAAARIDHVLLLDQVASKEDIERRNRETGRMTDPVASVKMTAALEKVYQQLGCQTTRIAAGTVEQRAAALMSACQIEKSAERLSL